MLLILLISAITIASALAGSPTEHCDPADVRECRNICQTVTCLTFPGATCVMNRCSRCEAEFYVKKRKVLCEQYGQAPDQLTDDTTLPQIDATGEDSSMCENGVRLVNCPMDPCKRAKCPLHPNAECRTNRCGKCVAEFFNSDNTKLECYKRSSGRCQPPNCRDKCPFGRIRGSDGCETCVCKKARF